METDDLTPAERPEEAIHRLAKHLGDLCPAFYRCAGLWPTIGLADRPLFLEGLIDIAAQARDRFDQAIVALKEQRDLEAVFHSRRSP